MVRKGLWVWCLLIVAVGAVLWFRTTTLENSSDKPLDRTRVVFVTAGSNDFWQLTVKGAKAAAKEHNADLKVEWLEDGEDVTDQMQILSNMDKKAFDGCAVSPLDAEGQTRLINLLTQSMFTVTFDSDAPLSQRHYYIGTSNYRAGRICHEMVREALPEGGEIVVLLAILTKNNMVDRKAGYEQSHSDDKWKTVEYMIDEGHEAKVRENIQEALERHEKLACIVGMNSYHGPLLRKILAETGHLEKIKLVVFDETEETLAGIENGEIYATIAQDPFKYGYEAVRMLTSLHNGMSLELPIVGRGQINVLCEPIRKEDVSRFREKMEQRLGKNAAQ